MFRGERVRRGAALLLLAALPFAGGCRERTPAPASRPNVIVILVDTLRADRLGWHGTRGLTPFLDSLAEHGTTFQRAYTTSPWTAPAVASLFTSRIPTAHRVFHFGSPLPPEVSTLAEAFTSAGYYSIAVSAHAGLETSTLRGFEIVSRMKPLEGMTKTTADRVNDEVRVLLDDRWPEDRARPLFLYVHYMEPHMPFTAPEAIVESLLAREPDPEHARAITDRARRWVQVVLERMFKLEKEATPAERISTGDKDDHRRALELLYDAEVATLDQRVAELFAQLRARGLLDNAVVVLTADHGEEFYEHGNLGHGKNLLQPSLHIPLLIWRSAPAGRRIEDVVSLIDVAPTVLDAAGVPVPADFAGQSRVAALVPQAPWERWIAAVQERITPPTPGVAVSEFYPPFRPKTPPTPARSVIHGDEKLIIESDGTEVAYDLALDPDERTPLDDAARRERLRHVLAAANRAVVAEGEAAEPSVDAATRERLRALGYAE